MFHVPVGRRDSGNQTFEMRRILFLILTRSWVILLVILVGMLIVVPNELRKPDLYETKAVIQVEQAEQKILKAENVAPDQPGSAEYMNTVVKEITSPAVMQRVVRSEKLAEKAAFAAPLPSGEKRSEQDLAATLAGRVAVRIVRGTRLIEIRVRDKDPRMACELAGAVAKEFIRQHFQEKSSVSNLAKDFLTEEATKLKKKLEQSEQDLQRYREEHNAVSLEQNQNIVSEKLRAVSGSLTAAQDQALKLEADLELFRRTDASNLEELMKIPEVAGIPQVSETRQQLVMAESELDALKERYFPKHPKYIAAASKISSLRLALKQAVAHAGDSMQKECEKVQDTVNKLQESLKEQESKSLELGKLAIPYNVLAREVETDRALYASVVARMKETGVSAGIESTPFRLVVEPRIESTPLDKRTKQTLGMAFLLFFGLGVVGIIVHDRMSATIRTVHEAEACLHLPLLGSIPDEKLKLPELSPKPRKGKKARAARNPGMYPVVVQDLPASPIAEAYRTLRTSITLLGRKQNMDALLFTSAIPDEGKTFCSLNTAAAFAQLGHKTVLIDADLRRPSLHIALLDGEVRAGLADYLAGSVTSLDEIISPTRIPNLFLITAGNRSRTPTELLSEGDLDGFTKQLKERFKRVIFDTAPIHAVSDTLVLCRAAHEVVLVLRAESTPRQVIQRAINLLGESGSHLSGMVINRLSRGGAGYYYYYYRGKYSENSVYGSGDKS